MVDRQLPFSRVFHRDCQPACLCYSCLLTREAAHALCRCRKSDHDGLSQRSPAAFRQSPGLCQCPGASVRWGNSLPFYLRNKLTPTALGPNSHPCPFTIRAFHSCSTTSP